MNGAGIPTHCTDCGAALGRHNIVGLCGECKLVARNRRMSGQPADTTEPVTYDEAIANITTILGGRSVGADCHTDEGLAT